LLSDDAADGAATDDIAEQAADRVRARHPGLSVEARSVAGPVPDVLADQSAGADLLVVGHRGHGGFSGFRLGSVALRAVARAVCPSMVVRGSEHRTRGTVVAAVDVGHVGYVEHIGHVAEEILEVAFTEAALRGARLKVVSALEAFWPRVYAGDSGQLGRSSGQAAQRAEDALQRLLAPWPARYPDVVTDHQLIEGSPTAFLTGATTYADLIVVGVHRADGDRHPTRHPTRHPVRHGDRHPVRIGPVAETLLLHSDCPVAVVPHG
jgi:nucleotide-binding universal stress UspA family protein